MALPTFPQAVADLILALNDTDFVNGGHRTAFIPAVQGAQTLADWTRLAGLYLIALAEQVETDAASAAAGSGTEATAAQIRAGAAAEYVSIRRVLSANEPVALTRAAATTWDMASGINFDLILDGNVTTLQNPTNQIAGKSGLLRIVQDGTGGRTIADYGSNFIWLGGEAVIPTAAGSVLIVPYLVWTSGTIYLSNGGASA